MTDTRLVRISVHLTNFFTDHRQLARIFVNEDFKTIHDLKKHLKKVFDLKKNFFLLSQNHYLPSLQDIRVLNDGDSIHVIPILSNAADEIFVTPEKKKRKRTHENSIEKASSNKEKIILKEKVKNRTKHESLVVDDTKKIENDSKIKKKKKKNKNYDLVDLPMELECNNREIQDEISNEPQKKRKRTLESSSDKIVEDTIQSKRKSEKILVTRIDNNTKGTDIIILNEKRFIDNCQLQNFELTKSYHLKDVIDFDQLKSRKDSIKNMNCSNKQKPTDHIENTNKMSELTLKKSKISATVSEIANPNILCQNESSEIFTEDNASQNGKTIKSHNRGSLKQNSLLNNENNHAYINSIKNLEPKKQNDSIKCKEINKSDFSEGYISKDSVRNSCATDEIITSNIKILKDLTLEKSVKNVDKKLIKAEKNQNLSNNFVFTEPNEKNTKQDNVTIRDRTQNLNSSKITSCSENDESFFEGRIKKVKKNKRKVDKTSNWDRKDDNIFDKSRKQKKIIEVSFDNTTNLELSKTKLASWSDSESSLFEDNAKTKEKIVEKSSNLVESEESVFDKSQKHKNLEEIEVDETQNLNLSKTKMASWSDNNTEQKNNSIPEILVSNIIHDSEQKPKSKFSFQRLTSVGALLNYIPLEVSPSDFITKRRRVRVRKRSKKSIPIPETIDTQSEASYFQPPKTIAAPKIHKRFSDNEYDGDTSALPDKEDEFFNSPNMSKLNALSHSTPYSAPLSRGVQMSIIQEEKEDLTEFLNKNNVDSMKELKEPSNVNDRIMFQKLKLNEEYTPVISDYILGEIKYISNDKKNVEMKIIVGQDEFQEPQGIFTVEEAEQPQISIVDLEWNTLIKPRLYECKN